jgi:hypothetical protein
VAGRKGTSLGFRVLGFEWISVRPWTTTRVGPLLPWLELVLHSPITHLFLPSQKYVRRRCSRINRIEVIFL